MHWVSGRGRSPTRQKCTRNLVLMGSSDVEKATTGSTSAAESLPNRRRERDCLLVASRVLNLATGLCATLCVTVNAMAIALHQRDQASSLLCSAPATCVCSVSLLIALMHVALYVTQEAVGLLVLRIYSVAFGIGAILVGPSPSCMLQLSPHVQAMCQDLLKACA